MKIFLVLHGFPPETQGGTERAVEALARAMIAAGHEVVVVAGSLNQAPTTVVGSEEHDGLKVLRLHRDDLYYESWFKAYSPGVSAAFEALLAEHRPDVVHVHHWIRLSSDLIRLSRAAGCVTAVTLHDYFSVLGDPVRRADRDQVAAPRCPSYVSAAEAAEAFELHRRDFLDELSAAQLCFAPSAAHARGVQEVAPGALPSIEVTPPPLLDALPRRRLGDGPRGRRLVTWGALYEDKGLDCVLDALAQVAADWSLEVLGEAHQDDYRARIEQRASGLAVTWRGAFGSDDLASVEADYALLPSLCHESYGLTMDEALGMGLPVIASDLPVYRERAPAESCAFYPPGDAGALAAVLDDEARLQQLTAPTPPEVVDARAAAARLLELYGSAAAAPAALAAVTDRDRALALFRRAERRLWTALQQDAPPAPPDDFLS